MLEIIGSAPLKHICNYVFGEKCLPCDLPRAPASWIFLVLPKLGYWSYLWIPQVQHSQGGLVLTSFAGNKLCAFVTLWFLWALWRLHSFEAAVVSMHIPAFIFHTGQVNIFSNIPQAWSTHPLVCGSETASCRCINSPSEGAEDKLYFQENLVPSERAGLISQPTYCLILHVLLF